jgi:hypothetical protein
MDEDLGQHAGAQAGIQTLKRHTYRDFAFASGKETLRR